MEKDLDKIKKLYGEEFAKKICRAHFAHLIEREDFSLADFLTTLIAPTKFFYEDLIKHSSIEEFKNYVLGLIASEQNRESHDIQETPEELMKKAGYTLYKCETNEDIHKFEKYYEPKERLCTFGDDNRINTHTIFWAVKDNVDEIKRENFKNPRRQDEYGTSVISLQFTKGRGVTLSIKNRYNHTVEYCDATFSNDLENIQAGLTDSFKKYYGIEMVRGAHTLKIPGYVMDNNGIYYKYNNEINNIYYCVNNVVIINGEAIKYDPTQYVLADYFLIDRKTKNIDLLPNSEIEDSFVNQFYGVKKIDIEVEKDKKLVYVHQGDDNIIEIVLNKYNQIESFSNEQLEEIQYGFMSSCLGLKSLNIPQAKIIGYACLSSNIILEELNAPKLQRLGEYGFSGNLNLKKISLPSLVEMEGSCFTSNQIADEIDLSSLESVGWECFYENTECEKLILPKLKKLKPGFFVKNTKITTLRTPKLKGSNRDNLPSYLRKIKQDNLIVRLIKELRSKKEAELEL